MNFVPVAQLDRALVCGTKGCRFDSGQVRVPLTYNTPTFSLLENTHSKRTILNFLIKFKTL